MEDIDILLIEISKKGNFDAQYCYMLDWDSKKGYFDAKHFYILDLDFQKKDFDIGNNWHILVKISKKGNFDGIGARGSLPSEYKVSSFMICLLRRLLGSLWKTPFISFTIHSAKCLMGMLWKKPLGSSL